MTIQEIRQLKTDTEKSILDLLITFQERTGLEVKTLAIMATREDLKLQKLRGIKMDVKLDL